jgi:hypothetical protein
MVIVVSGVGTAASDLPKRQVPEEHAKRVVKALSKGVFIPM